MRWRGNQVYSGSYTGLINFTNPSTNDIVSFLNTAGGTFVGSVSGLTQVLSSGGFSQSTLIDFRFTIGAHDVGTITHDDGISIYDATNTTKILDSSFPTSPIGTSFDLLPGTYNLWYAEVNGLPADLIMDVERSEKIPEPATLALLGIGLAGFGFSRRRKPN